MTPKKRTKPPPSKMAKAIAAAAGLPELRPRRAMFVNEYLVDLNATQAAIRAGYSPAAAAAEASRLLNDVKIAAAVETAIAARVIRTGVSQDRVIAELAKLGFANMMDYVTVQPSGDAVVDLSSMTRDQAAALAEITVDEYVEGKGDDARDVKRVKIKLADKRAALVDLGRHVGVFKDPAAMGSLTIGVVLLPAKGTQ